ncbi:MAG: PAS domain-containing protein [Ignavibacteriae bacterium]|nr:PAS domain-containing protein [Ignavibacteriota bacterium]
MLLLTLFIVSGVFYTISFLNVQESSGAIINIAGRQRMLTQKMSKEALGVLNGIQKPETLKSTSELFQTSLSGLIYGEEKLHLPPVSNDIIKTQLLKVKGLWEPFQTSINVVAEISSSPNKISEAKNYISKNNITLLKEMNKAVKLFEENSTEKVASLKTTFYFILLIVCLIVGVSLFVINSQIFKPMKIVMDNAYRIGSIKNLAYEKNNDDNVITEIKNNKLFEQFANSINSILKKIQHQSELLNNLPTPVLSMDKQFNITYINKIGASLVGKGQEELTGLKCYDQMKTHDCQTSSCACDLAMKNDKMESAETVANPGNNNDLPIYYKGKPTRDGEGNINGAVEFIADLTPTKEKEKYLDLSVQKILSSMEKIATGDLTVQLQPEGESELIDSLFLSINKTTEKLSNTILQINEAVDSTINVSTQIAASVEEMGAGAEEQNNQTQAIATSMDEMTRTVIETTGNTNSAADSANQAGILAEDGGKVVNETVDGIEKIATIVQKASGKIIELGNNSDKIGEIVQVINEIAEQTNLLALNAAIEAARAGEHGRGFAVVADEVRKLSERTSGATQEIANMIEHIQSDTQYAVTSINEGNEEVQKGKELAQKAGSAILDIVNTTNKVVDEITQVAKASEGQVATSEQISQNIEMINNVASETLIGIQQVAGATSELNEMTENLQSIISQFNVGNGNTNNYEVTNQTEKQYQELSV